MHTVNNLLAVLADNGVRLSVDGDQLNCYAPKGSLTEGHKTAIQRHRTELMSLLKARQANVISTTCDEAHALATKKFPMTIGAQSLYIFQELDPSSSAFNVPLCLNIVGTLDIPLLEKAWNSVLRQHPVLTARVDANRGFPVLMIEDDCVISLRRIQIDVDDDSEALSIVRAHAHLPFDLRSGPLVRIELFQRDDSRSTLLITAHHIIFDGMSGVLLLKILLGNYRRMLAGTFMQATEVSFGYADFSMRERDLLSSPDGAIHAKYWRDRLAGIPLRFQLVPDARPSARRYKSEGTTFTDTLGHALSESLRSIAATSGMTLSSVLLAVFVLLLRRYSGDRDIVIGMPVSLRSPVLHAADIGYFVNMVALRIECDESFPFLQYLRKVQHTMVDALYHSAYPIDGIFDIQSGLKSKSVRETPHGVNSIFQVSYAYQDFLRPDEFSRRPDEPGPETEYVSSIAQEGESELGLQVFNSGTDVVLQFGYDPGAYEREIVIRFFCHYRQLLQAVAENPNKYNGEFDYLSSDEKQCVLYDFNHTRNKHSNDTVQTFPLDRCVHQLFESQVSRTPEATAVACGTQRISYSELNVRANRLAHHLLDLGIKPDDRVAICAERGVDMVVAMFATLKSGGAYVPLDSTYPPERLHHMLADSAPAVVLTCGAGAALIAACVDSGTAVLDLVADADKWCGLSDQNPATESIGLTSRHLAYVIYTSGSTGTPKGVMIEHRGLVNYTLDAIRWFDLTGHDVVLQQNSLNFDLSIEEILPPLLCGACLMPSSQLFGTGTGVGLGSGDSGQLTVVHLTAAHWHVLVGEWGESAARMHAQLAGIRLLNVTGDALSMQKLGEWESIKPEGVRLINTYGPTEATISCSAEYVRYSADLNRVSIGRPFANTSIYILDDALQPVPIGVSGELYIGGVQVARGYLNRPELTSERFIDSPFRADERLYKTGDLGRWMTDGTIDYLGRNDFQVKIRGFRIETGEIESALCACDGIREAVVLAREEAPGEKRLVAYYMSDQELDSSELRERVSQKLPEHMLPSAFVRMELWPLTPNGKLDRAALPEPEGDAYAGREYEAPQGEIETTLAAIWSELLRVEQVGRNDNFFDLGGHSLLVTQAVSRIRDLFSVDLHLRAFFDFPILSQLADRIAQSDPSRLSAIVAVKRETYMPLSLAQQRLWVLTQIDGASAAYHMGGMLRLEGALDRPALQRALQHIVDRHEALRTRFVLVDDQPMQAIMTEAQVVPGIHDLRDQIDRDSVCRALGDAFMVKPFDLRHDLPLRVQLVRLEDRVHELQVVVHHIVSDGWSVGIMLDELSRLYTADVQGLANPLSALPIQYIDYAMWQREWLAEGLLARQTEFWLHNLAGAPTLLEIPTDRRRPARQDFVGDAVQLRLDAAMTTALKMLSQRHGVTLYMTLLASWAAVLGRLSNQDEVVIGSPVAGRNRAEVEPLIGFFVNTLAMRIDLSGAPTVGELLARTRHQVLAAQAHQDLPFDQVVEAVKPPRDMAYSPIFQTMLAWQSEEDGKLELPGIVVSVVEGLRNTEQFDLTLNLTEAEGEIHGTLNYATALFDRETIARYVGYWRRLLSSMAVLPLSGASTRAIRGLPILSADERRTVLYEWNTTARDYPQDRTIHGLFEDQAAKTPEATALVFGEVRLSYSELNARANRLAHYLIALGVKPDDRVAICVERSLEMVVGLLGVLKAGGAYVPLDPSYPGDRLQYMLNNCAPKAVLSHGALSTTLAALVGDCDAAATFPVLAFDRMAALPENDANPCVEVRSSHLAYMIYTSGSTGLPKGAMNEHGGVVNRLLWAQEQFALDAQDSVLQKTTFGFDVAVWEFFLPLLAGARLVMAQPGGHQDPGYLVETIERYGITVMHFVPSMLQVFLAQDDLARCGSLRHVKCSGEALPYALQQRFHAALPSVQLHNLYGPTEAAVDVTYWRCNDDRHPGIVPIGKPVANTAIYLLDPQGEPVPVRVAGELFIAGAQVGRGYLNSPELTAERFLHDPFSPYEGARMYRTGDLARWMHDGNIEYLGRNDFQVKIRGFRIELGEIEATLAACEGISEAVVIAREDSVGEKRLVAYYVADTVFNTSDLRQRLSQNLPEYMLPAAFVRLIELPLTSNGKLDRKALPAPDGEAYASRAYVAPEDGIEQTLAAIWLEVLKIDRIGRHDNFFELGGHSLLAVQLLWRLHNVFNVEVPLRMVFESPTLSQLADRIAQSDPSRLSAIIAVKRETYMPLSLAQQRLWVLTQIDGASAAYHMGGMLRLEGALDRPALQRALQHIVDRHEALRTRFVLVDDQPMQAIMTEAQVVPGIHDLRDQIDRDSVCRALGDAFMVKPFDLRHDLPLRVQLVRLEDRVHELQVVVHHIVSDGWSVGIMLDELSRLYTADVQGLANPLSALPIQYIDYAMWQREWLAEGLLARQTEFWLHNLAGAPTLLEIPTDRRRPARQDFVGDAVQLRLDAAMTTALKMLSQRHGVTLYMTLLASWAAVLGRLSNQDEVVIGSPVAGRNRAEVEPLIGFFVNTLAMRIDLSGAPTVGELLARTRHQVLAAQAHQDLPFDQVVEAVKPPRDMAYSPIFQTMLAWQSEEDGKLELPGIVVSVVEGLRNTEQFDLTLNLTEAEGEIHGTLNYATALFDRETIARYVGYWRRLLSSMAVLPLSGASTRAIRGLPILSADERRTVLYEWNTTARDYPQDRTIHGLFEDQAAKTPEATALVFGEVRLSYSELNARANRLAHYLIALGVKPDDRVAICVERSLEMVVGLLGVLKAGGAYVPLDPSYPGDRLQYMLNNCAPKAVLSHGALSTTLAALVGDCDAAATFPVLAFDRMAALPENDANPCVEVRSSHLAYMIYTSGSTGLPKGAMNEHGGVVNRLLWAQEQFALDAQDSVLQKTTFGFDVAVWEFFLPLLAGARLVMAQPGGHQDPGYLVETIERYGITVMHFVPSMLQVFLAQDDLARCGSLRHVKCSGEALPYALQQRFHAALPSVQLHNLYGPTEAAVDVTYWRCNDDRHPGIVPIGKPVANTAIYLLDPQGEPVPVRVAGELFIAGAQVGRGYLNSPELTAERFLHDPFSPYEGARMYRTGDLARWMHDGNIEYLGRNDFQVKIRGFRIELGEIEATLAACEGISEAVVIAREDSVGEKRLVAYYVADTVFNTSDLRQRLSQNLPEYMLPAAFVRLIELPLTSNGKLDRKALPAPDGEAYASRAYVAPEDGIEQTLAAIWLEVLKIDRIGRHDNFFELGGHSLLAVQLLWRLHNVFNVEVPLRMVFESPTLSQLADRIAQSDPSRLSAIIAVKRETYMPLSLAQQRLWVLTQIDGASAAYHMGGMLRLEGALDRPALQRALQHIVDRHEALRTRFVLVDDQPMQAIMTEAQVVPGIHDLRDQIDRDNVCRALGDAFMVKPFDLRHDLPLRVQLIRLEDRVHELQVVVHHIVSDGWSVGIMLDELSRLYTADVQGLANPLSALPIQYTDYAMWQREWLAEGQFDQQSAFWRTTLSDAPMLLELPADRARPLQQDFAGDALEVQLDTSLTSQLKALSLSHGVTLYMTLLASWAAVLGRLSNQKEVVIGSPMAGRNRAEIESLIGFFVNTLAMRIDLSGAPTVGELLARTRHQVLTAQAHQDLPFDQVVEAVKPARSTRHSPIFQTMLTFNNQETAALSMSGLDVRPVMMKIGTEQFDLSLDLSESDGALSGSLSYAISLFDRGTMERYLGHWLTLLRGMASEASMKVSHLPILDDAERHHVLTGWNGTVRNYPRHALRASAV